ncbi:hypothetical protein [Noviherbaspirillum galbum]|uniref:Uncharacterized protein n=1 Tax=Noviherbaspirillum galbum TaxID=2709383 RepID=A0A6B3SP87_9BURK|nr:hypothetical protein [Noviherbaspirillum galbum]NEX60526.1 hypothetical protein [Noviherbaspirillum galbum]
MAFFSSSSSKQEAQALKQGDLPAGAPDMSDMPSAAGEEADDPVGSASLADTLADTLANHKGKLAMGAAAMLGLAVFYKWREGRLAQDDPEEYARLQRIKAAVDLGEDEQ